MAGKSFVSTCYIRTVRSGNDAVQPARLDAAKVAMQHFEMTMPLRSSLIKSVCVYCGSGPGNDPVFADAATAFGKILATSGVKLVYGGGSIGLMGAVATAALENGGKVTGIIPEFLVRREHAMEGVKDLIITKDMHERKQLMFEHSDAFVALPGGVGTLEELVEQLTWSQLGRHKKPILLANVKGFWEPLCALLDHMKALAFIRAGMDVNLMVADKVDDIIPKLRDAMQGVPEQAKDMPPAVAEKL